MVPAHTLKSIMRHVKNTSLNSNQRIEPLSLGFMVSGMMPNETIKQNVKLIGILFARPEKELAQKEILPSLPYFHTRSGKNCNFYCAGYGAYWNELDYPDMRKIQKIDTETWYYSDTAFNDLRNETEENFNWSFSGETDLILLSLNSNNELDKNDLIVFNLEEMTKDNRISSVGGLFEKIFRFSDQYTGNTALRHFREHIGI